MWRLSLAAARILVLELADLSLLHYDAARFGEGSVRLHKVIRDFLFRAIPNPVELHRELVERWGNPLLLTDPYRSNRISWHLRQADDLDRLCALVTDESWYEARLERDPSASAFLRDLTHAWEATARHDAARGEAGGRAPLLAQEIRYALFAGTLHGRGQGIPSRLLAGLVGADLWRPAEALSVARQNPNEHCAS